MTHIVRELEFHGGDVVFSGTKQECLDYKQDRDKGYAGVCPFFIVEPAPSEVPK